MTSPAMAAANRQNAKKSTGPRTRAGKERVSRNALRHGLATDIQLDPILAPQIEGVARAIAGSKADERVVLDAARLAAAAELDLIRIRRIRSDLLRDLALSIEAVEGETEGPSTLAMVTAGLQAGLGQRALLQLVKEQRRSETQPSLRVSAITAELTRIERYESRAMSRRKGLLRTLDALLREGGERPK